MAFQSEDSGWIRRPTGYNTTGNTICPSGSNTGSSIEIAAGAEKYFNGENRKSLGKIDFADEFATLSINSDLRISGNGGSASPRRSRENPNSNNRSSESNPKKNPHDRIRQARTRAARIRSRSRERQNCDAMSTASSIIEPNRSRGRTRHRSETGSIGGYSDYGLPPTHSQLSQRHRQGSVTSLLSNKSGQELVYGLEEFRARNQEELAKERLEAQREKQRLGQLMNIGVEQPSTIKDKIRDLEAQLDETLASLRMEKALVCGELSEEEGMLQLERAQLSDISDMKRNRDEDLIHELQKTIQERSMRIDSLKNQLVGLDAEIREETLRLNAERDEQILALQREEKILQQPKFQRKAPSYCTGPRHPRRRLHSGTYSHRDDVSSVLSVESYGSNNSNWVTERSMASTYTTSDHQVKEMQRLLMEVQAEKERLIRSLAAGSVENMITSSDDQTCGQTNGSMSNYTSPNSLNFNSNLDASLNQSSIVNSPIKDSSPESRTQSVSDIGASASQYGADGVILRSTTSPHSGDRSGSKENRPLTRYLPNTSSQLDLKLHLESLGHSASFLHQLILTSTSMRGTLTKLASRKKRRPWKRWQNRWILFDRHTRSIQWFNDKHEKRSNGVIFFPDIQDVFIDHTNKHKAPKKSIGIVIIASSRRLVLSAKTPELARIWVDAIVTGCEGNTKNNY